MNVVKFALVGLVLSIVFITGCKKDLVATVIVPDANHEFYGNVVDENGNPVGGVNVHYIFSFPNQRLEIYRNQILLNSEAIPPSTIISFGIPTRQKVTVTILRWFTRDTITVLFNDTLNVGNYTFTLNTQTMTNGFYIYQIKTDTKTIESRMHYLDLDVSRLITTNPLVKSNLEGSFVLPYGLLGFGISFARVSPDGTPLPPIEISDTIQVVLFKPGYRTLIKEITIPHNSSPRETFILKKNI
ncbi:MAG: hypothetical protein WC209_08920 [Ignavibacteriaceae bacterium]|jgi:hypothetical protein